MKKKTKKTREEKTKTKTENKKKKKKKNTSCLFKQMTAVVQLQIRVLLYKCSSRKVYVKYSYSLESAEQCWTCTGKTVFYT